MSHPAVQLHRDSIAQRIPHQGAMCLLDGLIEWSDSRIQCLSVRHADPLHPLRGPKGLSAAVGIEYASQAMALHGALRDQPSPDGSSRPGFLAASRGVILHLPYLDGIKGPLLITAERQAGNEQQAIYQFQLSDMEGLVYVEGRATVVLQPPA